MTHTSDPRPLRLALAHESELVTEGLRRVLADHRDRVTLVPSLEGGAPAPFVDLTLHDSLADLPRSLDAVGSLLRRPGGGRLVTFTWNPRADLVDRVLDLGVCGCLSKDLPVQRLLPALEAVHAGERVVESTRRASPPGPLAGPLTPREAEIVSLITTGLDNNSIAQQTFLSINSVKSHIRAAYRKMGVASRSQAVLWGIRHGYGSSVEAPAATDDRGPAVLTG